MPRVSGLRLSDELRTRPGAESVTIVTIHRELGFIVGPEGPELPTPISEAQAATIMSDRKHGAALKAIFQSRDIEDILVATQGDYLRILDSFAPDIPLCSNMERTQNSLLQQRAHLRTWLDRGHDGIANIGAGHIRWGKAIKGLTGKLAEFTARHVDLGNRKGHMIRIELPDGSLAHHYATSLGKPLAPELHVTSRAQIRRSMASALRAFAGSTSLMNGTVRR